MQPDIRLLEADGATEINQFDYQPTVDEYFFTFLNVRANKPFYVEISHHNSDTAAGLYDISSGAPLSGEIKQVYLPVIMRNP